MCSEPAAAGGGYATKVRRAAVGAVARPKGLHTPGSVCWWPGVHTWVLRAEAVPKRAAEGRPEGQGSSVHGGRAPLLLPLP
jgi:hypothetical protein